MLEKGETTDGGTFEDQCNASERSQASWSQAHKSDIIEPLGWCSRVHVKPTTLYLFIHLFEYTAIRRNFTVISHVAVCKLTT